MPLLRAAPIGRSNRRVEARIERLAQMRNPAAVEVVKHTGETRVQSCTGIRLPPVVLICSTAVFIIPPTKQQTSWLACRLRCGFAQDGCRLPVGRAAATSGLGQLPDGDRAVHQAFVGWPA